MCFVISDVPTVTQQVSCDLPADISYTIGLGPTSEVLVGRKDSGTILKYKCSDAALLTVVWEKLAPQGMSYNCYKFITGNDGDIVLHNLWTGATHIYTSDLVLKSQYPAVGMYLLAANSERLLYRVGVAQYVVATYNMKHEGVASLMPPMDREWSYGLSACAVHDSDNMIVTDKSNKWLDVFSAGGTIIIHI